MSGELVVVRHGRTTWSDAGKHTGRTDVPLAREGEQQATRLADLLADRHPALVLTSPLQRASRTAALAGLAAVPDADLVEWDYGGYEGRTTAEISAELGRPWSLWRDGVVPGATPGETVEQVAERARRVLARVRPALADGDVVVVAHGHLLRVLAACWLGLPPADGALLALDAGSLGVLGFEHEREVVRRWGVEPLEP